MYVYVYMHVYIYIYVHTFICVMFTCLLVYLCAVSFMLFVVGRQAILGLAGDAEVGLGLVKLYMYVCMYMCIYIYI